MSPLFSVGSLFILMGILIIVFPNLLEIIVAIFLIIFGLSIINIDRVRRGKRNIFWFSKRTPKKK